jgi:hypothetical protein
MPGTGPRHAVHKREDEKPDSQQVFEYHHGQ